MNIISLSVATPLVPLIIYICFYTFIPGMGLLFPDSFDWYLSELFGIQIKNYSQHCRYFILYSFCLALLGYVLGAIAGFTQCGYYLLDHYFQRFITWIGKVLEEEPPSISPAPTAPHVDVATDIVDTAPTAVNLEEIEFPEDEDGNFLTH